MGTTGGPPPSTPRSGRSAMVPDDEIGAADEPRPDVTDIGPDGELAARALLLSRRYLGGHARPRSVRWVDTMTQRWGSCTPASGTIRISRRLQTMPTHVRDYVLLHELTHLLIPDHGPNFWTLLGSYPHVERALGYLEGIDHTGEVPRRAARTAVRNGSPSQVPEGR